MSSIQTSLLNLVVAFMLIVSGHNDVRADDCGASLAPACEELAPSPAPTAASSTCATTAAVAAARAAAVTWRRSDQARRRADRVAIFVPDSWCPPLRDRGVLGAFGQHPFGDRRAQIAAAKEKWEAFDRTRKALEARGHAINVAKLEVETDLKDAVKQQTFPPLSTRRHRCRSSSGGRTCRASCRTATSSARQPASSFRSACSRRADRELRGSNRDDDRVWQPIERPVTSSRTDANGSCLNAGDLRCMHPACVARKATASTTRSTRCVTATWITATRPIPRHSVIWEANIVPLRRPDRAAPRGVPAVLSR